MVRREEAEIKDVEKKKKKKHGGNN